MKYVDWVRTESAQNDYAIIAAYLVAHSFSEGLSAFVARAALRNYTRFRRKPHADVWRELDLVRYEYDDGEGVLSFEALPRS